MIDSDVLGYSDLESMASAMGWIQFPPRSEQAGQALTVEVEVEFVSGGGSPSAPGAMPSAPQPALAAAPGAGDKSSEHLPKLGDRGEKRPLEEAEEQPAKEAEARPPIPDFLKMAIFDERDNAVLHMLMRHQDERSAMMSPYMIEGLGGHFVKFGPIEKCAKEVGDGKSVATLWPVAVDLETVMAEIRGQADASTFQVPLSCWPQLEDNMNDVGNAANIENDTLAPPPCTVSAQFATPFMMAESLRLVQTRSALAVMTHGGQDSLKSEVPVDGHLKQLEALDRSIRISSEYKSCADLEAAKLRAEDIGERDKPVAALLVTSVAPFVEVVESAEFVQSTLCYAFRIKLDKYLCKFQDAVKAGYHPDWRNFFGIPMVSSRVTKKAKKVFKDEARFKKIGPAIKQLAQAMGVVSPYNGSLVKLDTCLDVSRQIIHDANLYLAMIGVLNNTVIKPGQGYPNETLAKESKKCVKSFHTKYGLWLPRDDGKETVSEDYYFSSRQRLAFGRMLS